MEIPVKYQTLGTVSWGTHRNEDLIPAFVDSIQWFLSQNPYWDERKACEASIVEAEAICENETYDEENSDYVLEDLYMHLNHMAPEGYLFSTNEGDGADFGFWAYCMEDCEACPHENTEQCPNLESEFNH